MSESIELCFMHDSYSTLNALKVIEIVNYLKNISPIKEIKNIFESGILIGINIVLQDAAAFWCETITREKTGMPYIEDDIISKFKVYFEI